MNPGSGGSVAEILSLLANLAVMVAAVAAAWAAYESRRSANASRAASEAQLVAQSMKEYFEPEMVDALRALSSWRDSRGPGFAEQWLQSFKDKDPEAVAVDQARRHVKAFFDKSVRLFDSELVGERAFREMAYTAGMNLYYDVVVPLEDERNPTRRKRTEETLRRVLGRYEAAAPSVR